MIETSAGGVVAQLVALDPLIAPGIYLLSDEIYTIGRASSCQIVIPEAIFPDKMVSRLHAKIERSGPRYVLTDLGSANGTYINGRRLRQPHLLSNNDRIGLGLATPLLSFVDPDPTFMPRARLSYDERTMAFSVGWQVLALTPKQFRLLHYLYRHAGEVCTRENCMAAVWTDDDEGKAPGSLEEHISNLRAQFRRIDPTLDPIRTRRGVGYLLDL
jgi:DNA-binding response OmpR family regulator